MINAYHALKIVNSVIKKNVYYVMKILTFTKTNAFKIVLWNFSKKAVFVKVALQIAKIVMKNLALSV
jgi:hypothetical protein